MRVPLACPVRECGELLQDAGRGVACPRGHRFDRAREGYLSLLQPQDRRSPRAGDALEATAARARWLASGAMDHVAREAADLLAPALAPGCRVLDVGCGDGWWLERLASGRDLRACGIDLSRDAIRRACRRLPGATWVIANADRALPLPDGAVDVALSLFSRRPGRELARVLRPGGLVLVAVPAEDDLVELRAAVQGEGRPRDRTARVHEDLAGLERVARRTARTRRRVEPDLLEDALAMGYRGARRAERARRAGLDALDLTVSADLLLFRTPPPAAGAAPGSPDPGGRGPTRPG